MYSHVLSGFPSWESRPQVALRAGAMCLHPKVNALDQAVQYFEFLLDNPPAPYTAAQVQFVLAGLYQRQGRVNLAKDVYADCLKKERESRKKEIMKRKQERAESAMMARTTENKTSEQSTGGEQGVSTKSDGTPDMRAPIPALPKLNVWLQDPEVWRERARFHFRIGLFPPAVNDMSQALRLSSGESSGLHHQFRPRTMPEWRDWELLAISLGRMTEKESALRALERAFRLNPYEQPVRLRARISRWDPRDGHFTWNGRTTTRLKSRQCSFEGARGGSVEGLKCVQRERDATAATVPLHRYSARGSSTAFEKS